MKKIRKRSLLTLLMIAILAVSAITVSAATKTKYTITFDANGGKKAPVKVTASTSAATFSYELTYNKPVRSGYAFLGWNTQKNGKGKTYRAGSTIKLKSTAKSIILYAKWKKGNAFTIRYLRNKGKSVPAETIKVSTGTTMTVTIDKAVPTRSGYAFKEWNTKANGKGTGYQPQDTISYKKPAEVKLYAIWSKIRQYYLGFDTNGGSAMDPVEVSSAKLSERLYIPEDEPVRDGYTFAGWNTKRDGTGKVYQPPHRRLHFSLSGRRMRRIRHRFRRSLRLLK